MSTLPQLFLPLNDGVDIPQIGVVSFRNDSIDTTRELIINRVDAGFRHIEVSELFGNGHLILESVVEEAEIPRENLFVTLKIWPNKRRKQELIDACKSTLASIGLEYVDLCIIHAPLAISKLIDQWRGLEFLKQEGYVKSIGVGKVTHTQLSDVIKNCSILPAVVELEVSPFGQKLEIVDYCSDSAIIVMSNNPLVKDIYSNRSDVLAIADDANVTLHQLLVRWAITKGYCVLLPPTSNSLGNNMNEISQPLTQDIMKRLDALEEGLVTSWEIADEE